MCADGFVLKDYLLNISYLFGTLNKKGRKSYNLFDGSINVLFVDLFSMGTYSV